MKKAVCIALATAMFAASVAVFSGCEMGTVYESNINWDVDLSQPIELTGLFPATGMTSFGKDDTAKIIEDKTGYKVKYEELGITGMETDVSNYLTDQKPYDFMKLNDGCFSPYLENGTFLDLTELLEKTPEGKVLYQLIDLMDNGWESVKYVDNEGKSHIYGIPDFGYVRMVDAGLIWNKDHLKQIGFEAQYGHELPETLSEVTWAFETLQQKFNPDGKGQYHALGIPGASSAEVVPIESCFEVPYQFYVDDQGKIQQKNFSDNMTDYVMYMSYLRSKGILSEEWNGRDMPTVNQLFAEELHSCVYLTYWNVTALVNAVVSKGIIAKSMGVENTFNNMHDLAIDWTLRIRGDGYTFTDVTGQKVSCKNQEKALLPGDPGGVSYYTVIPAYMGDHARYVIDYLAKKMEAFADFFGGTEGVHWNRIDAPAGAPKAEDYTGTKENDAEFTKYESFTDKICFVRPYTYTYIDGRSGEDKEVTVHEDGKWIQLTDRYVQYIADNSQYCTGTNAITAKVYCHLHEIGFNAWYYCDNFADPSEWISNPMYMAPFMKLWAKVNINARSHLLTGVEHAINSTDPRSELEINRSSAIKKKFWTDEMSQEMTDWYNSSRNS